MTPLCKFAEGSLPWKEEVREGRGVQFGQFRVANSDPVPDPPARLPCSDQLCGQANGSAETSTLRSGEAPALPYDPHAVGDLSWPKVGHLASAEQLQALLQRSKEAPI